MDIHENHQRQILLSAELEKLSKDIIQDMAGEYVPNIEQRKRQFIEYHNELRELQGKYPRQLK